jgi:hypothetical protein
MQRFGASQLYRAKGLSLGHCRLRSQLFARARRLNGPSLGRHATSRPRLLNFLLPCWPGKLYRCARMAQTVCVFLFARATAATLKPRRAATCERAPAVMPLRACYGYARFGISALAGDQRHNPGISVQYGERPTRRTTWTPHVWVCIRALPLRHDTYRRSKNASHEREQHWAKCKAGELVASASHGVDNTVFAMGRARRSVQNMINIGCYR